MAYNKQQVLLGSGSSGTGGAVFVGDCRLLALSIQTSTGSASNVTIQGSNDDGFTAAVTHWSTMTVIPGQGIYTVDPGARWIRAERADIAISGTSNTTVTLSRYYQ